MYGFTKLGFTFRFYSDILDAGDCEQGVDIYDAETKEFVAEIPWADIEELEEMSDVDLQEWLEENI